MTSTSPSVTIDLLTWFHTNCCGLDKETALGSEGRNARQNIIGSVAYTTTVVQEADESDSDEEEIIMDLEKTEKQLRTILLRLIHSLDLMNAKRTTHDVVRSTDVNVDPKTGSINMNIFRNDKRPRRSWSPELCLNYLQTSDVLTNNFNKIDTWSIGILLSELLGLHLPWSGYDFNVSLVVHWSSINIDESLTSIILDQSVANAISPNLSNFLLECLWVRASRRPSIRELKMHPYLASSSISKTIRGRWMIKPMMFCTQLRHHQHTLSNNSSTNSSSSSGSRNNKNNKKIFSSIEDRQAIKYELQRMIQHEPSSSSHTKKVGIDDRRYEFTSRLFQLDLKTFRANELEEHKDTTSLSCDNGTKEKSVVSVENSKNVFSKDYSLNRISKVILKQKQVVKDQVNFEVKQALQKKDVTSQQNLSTLKYERSKEIKRETNILRQSLASILLQDGCDNHSLRSTVWCLLLCINPRSSTWLYPSMLRRASTLAHNIYMLKEKKKNNNSNSKKDIINDDDKEDTLAVKQLLNQLSKDIPRCHSYHTELSRPLYARRFVRVLMAWTMASKERMYWQGLDSMCAPILLLYKNEALACVVLEKIVDTFLPDIFIMNNHVALQERLLGLQHILTFLDPILSNHLLNIGVTPNLYAISWLLTMFAHVLKIDLVFQVWDVLLSLSCTINRNRRNNVAQGLPVVFAAVLLCRLRGFLLSENFASTTVFLTSLPCPMEEIVSDVLRTMPLACKIIPNSVLSLMPSAFEVINKEENDGNQNGSQNGSQNGNQLFEMEKQSLQNHENLLIKRSNYIEAIKYERGPRILSHEALDGPTFDDSLVIDVRAVELFQEIHMVNFQNVVYHTFYILVQSL
jgi:hypothetical protein